MDKRHNGTGLGLPLAKSLVELHDGELTLASKLDAGTTATVWMPAVRLEDRMPV
ncbi:MAG TPA: ATP-binding protein [Alphaproteobacteria bacterium]|nr:ATP-binding protein [Alphaproteobacteria bacterium]